MAVTRTVVLDDITPLEVAALFCSMNNDKQAEVFNNIALIAKEWPGAGWCQQSCDIVRSRALTDDGRSALTALAEHIELAKREG